MADHYYVNDNAQWNSGDHEVHKDGCSYLAQARSKTYLGLFSTCGEAVTAAKRIYPDSNGCRWCVPACHTS